MKLVAFYQVKIPRMNEKEEEKRYTFYILKPY